MKRHARLDLEQPDLIELLSLDDAGFKKKFCRQRLFYGQTPRPAAERLRRARNVGDQTALPILERATDDAEPLIVEHARGRLNKSNRRYEKDNHLRPHPDGLSTDRQKISTLQEKFSAVHQAVQFWLRSAILARTA